MGCAGSERHWLTVVNYFNLGPYKDGPMAFGSYMHTGSVLGMREAFTKLCRQDVATPLRTSLQCSACNGSALHQLADVLHAMRCDFRLRISPALERLT